LEELGLPKSASSSLLKELDMDGNSEIAFSEFKESMARWFLVILFLNLILRVKKRNKNILYKSKVHGSSIAALKACNHCAPTAPSTTLWSQLKVPVIFVIVLNFSSPFTGTTVWKDVPTARIAA
jgi:hypothetical protein